MNYDAPEWLKQEIEEFHQARIEILHQIKFDDLINNRSGFLSSGEITNVEELAYHLLDEIMSEREDSLYAALREKLKPYIPADKIGYYVAMQEADFEEEFNQALNRFTHEFLKEYSVDGRIDWRKLTKV